MTRNRQGPVLTVDALIQDENGRVLLIKRAVKPFKGVWCLPGGKVEEGERVEAALEREIIEELGVRIGIRELAGVYSEPDRDPRGHFVSVVYHATIIGGEPGPSSEVTDILWLSAGEEVELGFDHATILKDHWLSGKGSLQPAGTGGKKRSTMRRHPAEPVVSQVEDLSTDARLVEDEAGRGKRAVKEPKPAAKPMAGRGTKRTAAAARSGVTKRTSRGR
jgi:8-oxo-dGTP diphosphatase